MKRGVRLSSCLRGRLVTRLFAGAFIADGNPDGGLLNNPNENDGFEPDECVTKIDWDRNGCCDYPPDENQQDDQGNCHCDGISPPRGLR